MKRKLRKRYGHVRGYVWRAIYSVADDHGLRLSSYKTKKKAMEHVKHLENRGYSPFIYEFIEGRPERHRRIIYPPERVGEVAPPYRGGA